GIIRTDPPLAIISFVLDLIFSRLFDFAYSEYNGLAHFIYFLLCDGILTKVVCIEYIMEL
ncbi:hypothetical protein V8F20_002463, partial [Naviculisporaceae sp. PSN 640]